MQVTIFLKQVVVVDCKKCGAFPVQRLQHLKYSRMPDFLIEIAGDRFQPSGKLTLLGELTAEDIRSI
jgi:hypothetical protein